MVQLVQCFFLGKHINYNVWIAIDRGQLLRYHIIGFDAPQKLLTRKCRQTKFYFWVITIIFLLLSYHFATPSFQKTLRLTIESFTVFFLLLSYHFATPKTPCISCWTVLSVPCRQTKFYFWVIPIIFLLLSYHFATPKMPSISFGLYLLCRADRVSCHTHHCPLSLTNIYLTNRQYK